jgi:hypothetical protein
MSPPEHIKQRLLVDLLDKIPANQLFLVLGRDVMRENGAMIII